MEEKVTNRRTRKKKYRPSRHTYTYASRQRNTGNNTTQDPKTTYTKPESTEQNSMIPITWRVMTEQHRQEHYQALAAPGPI